MAICLNYIDYEAVEEHRQFQEKWKPVFQEFIDVLKNVEHFFVGYDYHEKKHRVVVVTDEATHYKCCTFDNPMGPFCLQKNHPFAVDICKYPLDKFTMGYNGYWEVDRPTDNSPPVKS